jgi:polyisoprenoid-binding protein YceI
METKKTRRSVLAHALLALGTACSLVAMDVARTDAASIKAQGAASTRAVAAQTLSVQARATGQAVRLTVVPSATVAHYRVREQLAFFSLPTDAVGTTQSVSGAIVLDAQGHVVTAQSKIVVDLRTLHTDQSRRDQFVQSNVLQTAQYPYAVFVVQHASGLPATLPATGKLTFKLVGNLTIHGVTRTTTWAVTATLGSQAVTGTASTQFDMTTFDITPPQVGPVLSVQKTVKLDIQVRMQRAVLAHV